MTMYRCEQCCTVFAIPEDQNTTDCTAVVWHRGVEKPMLCNARLIRLTTPVGEDK